MLGPLCRIKDEEASGMKIFGWPPPGGMIRRFSAAVTVSGLVSGFISGPVSGQRIAGCGCRLGPDGVYAEEDCSGKEQDDPVPNRSIHGVTVAFCRRRYEKYPHFRTLSGCFWRTAGKTPSFCDEESVSCNVGAMSDAAGEPLPLSCDLPAAFLRPFCDLPATFLQPLCGPFYGLPAEVFPAEVFPAVAPPWISSPGCGAWNGRIAPWRKDACNIRCWTCRGR